MQVDRSTAWPYDEHGEPRELVYQRQGHPTGAAAERALGEVEGGDALVYRSGATGAAPERALGELEGGDALLYGSGTSAVTACVLAFCRPGTTVALAAGAYYGTGVTLAQFHPWGLEVLEFDQTGAPPAGAELVWVESPSNPFLTVPDWE